MTGEQLLFAVLRSLLLNTPVPEVSTFEEFANAYRLAKKHDLAHLLYHVLQQQDRLPTAETEEQAAKLRAAAKRVLTVQYRYAKMEAELAHIATVLSGDGIPFVPLKGAVLCKLYPEPWMRTRGDIDLLVKNANFDRAVELLQQAGYTVEGERNYHDIQLLCDHVHLELHHSITERHKRMDALLEQVWDNTVADGYRHTETPTFFRFHHVAHMAHHFLLGGCGIRTVLDLWLLRRAPDHDEAAVRTLCEQAGLLTFYDGMCRLATVWFENGEHDAHTRAWAAYILSGGAYGTQTQRDTAIGATSGRFGVFWRILFTPYRDLKNIYPSLSGKPLLTPAYQIHWIFRRLGRRHLPTVVQNIKRVNGPDDAVLQQTRDVFASLDLK